MSVFPIPTNDLIWLGIIYAALFIAVIVIQVFDRRRELRLQQIIHGIEDEKAKNLESHEWYRVLYLSEKDFRRSPATRTTSGILVLSVNDVSFLGRSLRGVPVSLTFDQSSTKVTWFGISPRTRPWELIPWLALENELERHYFAAFPGLLVPSYQSSTKDIYQALSKMLPSEDLSLRYIYRPTGFR